MTAILLSLSLLCWNEPLPSPAPSISAEHAARLYRVAIYNTYRLDRAEYERRREIGDRLWASVQDGALARAEAIAWFLAAREAVTGELPGRGQGVLISLDAGNATAYSIEGLGERGVMFVVPQEKVYAGQVVGEHNRENDLTVNVTRAKQLTNFREATKEAFVKLKPARKYSLEQCLEYIEEDELVEITPTSVRMRKRLLNESDRKKADRAAKDRGKALAEA